MSGAGCVLKKCSERRRGCTLLCAQQQEASSTHPYGGVALWGGGTCAFVSNGAPGPDGAPGDAGTQGGTGNTGASGPQGPQGQSGNTGGTGDTGGQGAVGGLFVVNTALQTFLDHQVSVTSSEFTTTTGLTGFTLTPLISTPAFNPTTGIYTAPLTGFYWVTSTLNVVQTQNIPSQGTTFIILTSVNGNTLSPQVSVQSMSSPYFGLSAPYASTISGVVGMTAGDTLQIAVTAFAIVFGQGVLIDPQSTLAIFYLGPSP